MMPDHAFGKPLVDLFAENPEAGERFSDTMIALHGAEPPSVAAAYDFSTARTVVDVGGASGNMLAHILTRHAGPRGVLFDLPQATAGAPALLRARGVDDRVTIEHGSFLERVPAGGDIYLLSHVVHGWNDARGSLSPTHIKPFDVFAKGSKTGEWLAALDDS